MKTLTQEWLKAGHDDLEVIQEILDREDLTHIVAFHTEQCVEKVFKAILEEHRMDTPKIHNLATLYTLIAPFLTSEISEHVDIKILKRLNELYIDSRYPGEFGLLPNGKPTLQDAREFYQFAQDIYTTICARLQSADEKDSSPLPVENNAA